MNSFFEAFRAVSDGGKHMLRHDDQESVFYTDRSFDREAATLLERLNQLEPQQRLIYVAPLHHSISNQLNPEQHGKLVWLAPVCFTSADHAITDPTAWEQFLRDVGDDDRFTIAFHSSFAKFSNLSQLKDFVRGSLERAAGRLKTIGHFTKIWAYNYRRNQARWQLCKSIAEQRLKPPTAFVLGGSSVDAHLDALKTETVWCADTAVTPLVHHQIIPELVFSVDSGHGSFEHFNWRLLKPHALDIVLDPLSFPRLYEVEFNNVYSYVNSNPLVANSKHHFEYFENKSGDVYGLMQAVYEHLFKSEKANVTIYGRDGKSPNGISHLRGSGYYTWAELNRSRLKSTENYLYSLNRRF